MKRRSPFRISPSPQRGSLVIELTLLAVLLSFFSVGMLTQADDPAAKVQTALMKVSNDVRYAQHRAMVTGLNHGFRTLDGTQYEIYQQTPGNPAQDPSTLGPMQINLANDYQNVAFSAGYQVEFDSKGSPVLGGGMNIFLANGTYSRSFQITNNTGMLVLP